MCFKTWDDQYAPAWVDTPYAPGKYPICYCLSFAFPH